MAERRRLIDKDHPTVTVLRQCELFEVPRSTFYYLPQVVSAEELTLMKQLDELHMEYPFMGCRKLGVMLGIDKDHANRLMRKMGILAIYPKKKTSFPDKHHAVYPYLLRGLEIEKPNQVWATDITYVPMAQGFMYLTAVMDWHSRYVISWRLSNTMDKLFCIEALEEALETGVRPGIFNTDQGSQFTSLEFTGVLKHHGIRISMDGSGRWVDNVLVERLWRTVKHDEIYLHAYEDVQHLYRRLARYFNIYNHVRPHQSLGQLPPASVYFGEAVVKSQKH